LKQKKTRLDQALVQRSLVKSRQRGQALIMAGKVLVNELPADKPGRAVTQLDRIVLKSDDIAYVSRGGLKLEAVVDKLGMRFDDAVCLDVGASTGGFSDCLLQHGAKHVFAVDVGYGQLAWKLRQDPRVTVIERTNIRHINPDKITCPVDVITIDVSFISLKLVFDPVLQFANQGAWVIALIKPQFEVGKGQVGKGGVVRDAILHTAVIDNITRFATDMGMTRKAMIPSPILGPKGNREFLMVLKTGKSV
jgi:23S rRNA (cytidine1920-2'-O)/16S rRNA (cytidine1409-2'-O)-methyltransferase